MYICSISVVSHPQRARSGRKFVIFSYSLSLCLVIERERDFFFALTTFALALEMTLLLNIEALKLDSATNCYYY
jgi:hypothetical protein